MASSSSTPAEQQQPDISADEDLAKALALSLQAEEAETEQQGLEAVKVDEYDALSKEELLRELRKRDQELVLAVTEIQLLRGNVSKAEELGLVCKTSDAEDVYGRLFLLTLFAASLGS